MASLSIPPVPSRVLAFDIGIKNLAYAVVEPDTGHVIAVENINLLADTTPSDSEEGICRGCLERHAKKPSRGAYRVHDQVYCQKHVPSTHTVHPKWKKPLPTKGQKQRLQELLAETPALLSTPLSRSATIDTLTHSLSTVYAVPVPPPKKTNASKVSLALLHDLLRAAVAERAAVFRTCTVILLENQPAFKNPHMKSVQVLLFAVLRELFLSASAATPCPPLHLVHAAKKTKNHVIAAGDAGYADRKRTTEERVHEEVRTGRLQPDSWYSPWCTSKKRSDMADALCMCMDNHGVE